MKPPYFVAQDTDGCDHCGGGRTWTVIGPGDVAIGRSFAAFEDAEDLAEAMSIAHGAAYRDVLVQLREPSEELVEDISNRAAIGPRAIRAALAAAADAMGEPGTKKAGAE